jgi:hypothetical protein
MKPMNIIDASIAAALFPQPMGKQRLPDLVRQFNLAFSMSIPPNPMQDTLQSMIDYARSMGRIDLAKQLEKHQ